MQQISFSKSQARKIILQAAGLSQPAPFGTGPEAVYRLIDALGFVQIDTNYVVQRAHHHAIFSRVPDYQLSWLAELQEEGRIFECMMADSGFMLMPDYRFSLPVKASFGARRSMTATRAEEILMKQVIDRIGREGPLMVTDFENDCLEPGNGWWDWRPAKIALERLYMAGELMITRNKDFKKIYYLPTDLIPDDTDISIPSPKEYARYIIRRTLGALGLGYAKELAWRARYVKNNLVKKELPQMVAEGELCIITVEGVNTGPIYMLPEYLNRNIQLSGETYILSPFDILNVYRHRLRDFFDFDYQIECFVPEPKRKYGYFSLPILIGDRFVARMDAKADRKNKLLVVHNLHFEDIDLSDRDMDSLITALKKYVIFNECRDVKICKSNRAGYLQQISKHL